MYIFTATHTMHHMYRGMRGTVHPPTYIYTHSYTDQVLRSYPQGVHNVVDKCKLI